MSVVILGGNECIRSLKNKLGSPDLLVCFTSTMSHKMLRSALNELKGLSTVIAHCPTSSISALRGVLETHAAH